MTPPAAQTAARPRPFDLGRVFDAIGGSTARAIAGWVLPFAVVLALGLDNGGYDLGLRSEVGIALWWIVFVGALCGMVSFGRLRRTGWLAIATMGALAAWTALGLLWTESAERTMVELARTLTYAAILVLALAIQGRDGLRRTIASTGAGIAVIGCVALVSRMQPDWITIPAELSDVALSGEQARLAYPLNYWNGLAALMAIGIPLLLAVALRARSIVGQSLAAAAVPILALTAFLTLSRGGAIEIGVALVAFVALYPRRIDALPTLLLTAGASAILIASATQRDAFEAGLSSAGGQNQGNEMMAVALIVCGGVALLQASIGLATRYGLKPRLAVPRRAAAWLTLAALGAASVLALAAGVPQELNDRWEEFKEPGSPQTTGAARFESASGSGRYQTWTSAMDAAESSPMNGIGPGTYEYWYASDGSPAGFVRDAHSLYLEALAELGVIGFGLVVLLVGGALAVGVERAFRASEEKRALLAGATAACAAFAVAAGIDWVWELAVLPAAFFLIAAAICGPMVIRLRPEPRRRPRRRLDPNVTRYAMPVAALVALIAIAIPYSSSGAVGESIERAEEQRISDAIGLAGTAADIAPYAATPSLQAAILHEVDGDLDAASRAARDATAEEPTNWRTWLVRSRIEAHRGNAQAAVAAYRRARSLNPKSVLFSRATITLPASADPAGPAVPGATAVPEFAPTPGAGTAPTPGSSFPPTPGASP